MPHKLYRKKSTQPMIEWPTDFDMTGVSVSQADKENGSPRMGDMIAFNPLNYDDKWLVAEKFFKDNYEATPDVGGEAVAWEYERATEVSEGTSLGNRYRGFERKLSFNRPKEHPQFRNASPLFRAPPDAAKRIAELEKDKARLVDALKNLCTHNPRPSELIDKHWDDARALLAEMEGGE